MSDVNENAISYYNTQVSLPNEKFSIELNIPTSL
jgi:hypothetical protein